MCRAGVEPAQRLARVGYSHRGSPVPGRHVVSVPWMGFEPMLSTVRAWRPLRAGPPGRFSVAQGGVEPPASLGLSKGGLPVAYRAAFVRSAEGEGVEPPRLVARPGSVRVPSPVGLPFRLSLDGWIRTSVLRLPTPADETRLSHIQINPRFARPTKKAGRRVTPGLQGLGPEGLGRHCRRGYTFSPEFGRSARAAGSGRRLQLCE